MGEANTTATVEIDITEMLKSFRERLAVATAVVEAVRTNNQTATATYTANGEFSIRTGDLEIVVRSNEVE